MHPSTTDDSGSLALLFDHTLKLEKQERVMSSEIKVVENHTTHVACRVGRIETQLTQYQNTLTKMHGLLDTEVASRMQQDTHMMEVDMQAQTTLIRVGDSKEEIMATNGRWHAIREQLIEITRALDTYLRFG